MSITLSSLRRGILRTNVSTRGALYRALPSVRNMAAGAAMVPRRPAVRRGAFIVLEGADRAGKSTQCKMLVEKLQALGVNSELWRFPDRLTEIGQMINSYLGSEKDVDDAAIHLLFSANRWEKKDLLLNTLRSGTTVVVDRYAYSGAAFTAAKEIPGLTLEWCQAPDKGLPAPDAVLFLDLPVEVAQARGGFGEERYETKELQTRVLSKFKELDDGTWYIVDASRTLNDVHREVLNIALEAVERGAGTQEVAKLWSAPSPLQSSPTSRSPLGERSPLGPRCLST
eukprot:jgi/Botrbrau1/3019/Bobra.0070s0015.1